MSDTQPIAGPSRQAPERPLPSTSLYSIEFPGYLIDGSAEKAIQCVGGQDGVNRAFKGNTSKVSSLMELNWRPENPFSHPIPGSVVNSNNIVLKIRKRKLKQKTADPRYAGEYVVEAVGVTTKVVRFRSMADYQYTPDMSDPIAQLRLAMDRMDANAIKNYVIPPEKEDYVISVDSAESSGSKITERSNLRLFPPPVFSRQALPMIYNYKANNMSVATTSIDRATGAEKKRLINKARWKGYGPTLISFADKKVPTEPSPNVAGALEQANKRILDRLNQILNERPIWIRDGLLNQFPPDDVREINNSKILIPMVCYGFLDGPWRDTNVRLGYDPRVDPSARFFQRVYFRNINHSVTRTSVIPRSQDQHELSTTPAATPQQQNMNAVPSHIFDGVHLSRETAAFQLCDLTDPMLAEMVADESGVRDECNEREGWYTTHALERIKTVLRHKYFSLLEGHVATDEECVALLDPETATKMPIGRPQKSQPRKHNMAKGALPPEDAAVARLRAKLDIVVKDATSKRR